MPFCSMMLTGLATRIPLVVLYATFFYLGKHPITWSSKRQKDCCTFSHLFAFCVVASTFTEMFWIISLLRELGYTCCVQHTINWDNLRATHYATN